MQRIENLVGVGEDGEMNSKKNTNVPLTLGSSAFTDMTPRHQPQSFISHDFQRCLFDTPESLMGSPQFDMFSSPFRGQFAGRAPASRCTSCNNEIQGRQQQFTCSHIICPSCSSLSDSGKCPVPMCNSPSIPNASTPQFPAQMFLSPTINDSAMSAHSLHNHSFHNTTNGIASALQQSSLGIGGEPSFNIWDHSNSKLDTSISYDALSGGDDHPPVFSPVGSDSRFGSLSLPPAPPPSASLAHPAQSQHMSSMMNGPAPHCAPCGVEVRAMAFCANCRELLCADCVVAHHRVRITKEHSVILLEQLLQHIVSSPLKEAGITSTTSSSVGSAGGVSSSDNSSPRPSSVCTVHDAPVVGACSTCCGAVVCFQCLPLHNNHQLSRPGDVRSAASLLLCESRQREKSIDEAMEGVGRMSERVDASVQAVSTELRYVMHTYMTALEERKRELMRRLDTVRKTKVQALKAQGDTLMARKNALGQILKSLDSELNGGDELDESHLVAVFEQLMAFFAQPLQLDPQETDLVKFTSPDSQLLVSLRNMGGLESGVCARTSTLIGDGFRRAIRDRQCSVYVQLRDACGDVSTTSCGRNQVTAHILAPDGHPLDVQIAERETGIVSVSYTPSVDGVHILNIMVRGISISECPVSVDVRRGRNYSDIATQGELFSFGKEGAGDGELCRPWGICIDHRGRVLVADRSNNRIQVFDKDGNFLSKFGSSGTRPGQFDRPAGIAVNTLNHVIVADKDNHRVQVFDEQGNFMLKFGERGRPVGMFNYPWGVATNSQNHIAVSDTRNHRVQIFEANGQFLRKCGFDSAFFYKHLDSPRGLCYLPDGQLLITDFNNHRLAILSTRNSPDMKVYGSEGDVEGLFCRPQGVKVDAEGHILVCDSRNNRIQVFSGDDMRCVGVFGQAPAGFQMPTELPTPFQSAGPPSMLPFLTGGAAASSAAPPTPASPPSSSSSSPQSLDRPTDLAVSADGRVYVVDFGNNCIRVF